MAKILGKQERHPIRKVTPLREQIRAANVRLTYDDLLGFTPDNIRANARKHGCGRRFVGAVRKPNGLVTYVWKTGCSGREHMTSIEIPRQQAPRKLPVRVQCSCEYFVFTLEVVLASVGIAENRYALPQWPIIRNPSGRKHLCKHGVLVGNDFLSKARADYKAPENTPKITPSKFVMTQDQIFQRARRPKKK